MTTNRVSEAIARPARTAMQLSPAWVITEALDSLVWDMDDRQYGAVVGVLTLVIGTLQVLWENKRGKAILRSVPPRDVPPVDVG